MLRPPAGVEEGSHEARRASPSLILAVPKETWPGERRVALVPETVKALAKGGIEVIVEAGAGVSAGFEDESYVTAGATVAAEAALLLGRADLVVKVQPPRSSSTAATKSISSGTAPRS